VAISLRADYADGLLEPRSFQSGARRRTLDQLAGWAAGMRALRLRTAPAEGHSRPAPGDPAALEEAAHAVERLVAGVQDGLDRAAADVYDRQFASDVLWGSPYGATLSGYEALNAAHRAHGRGCRSSVPVPGRAADKPAAGRRDRACPPGRPVRQGQAVLGMAMYALDQHGGEWWLAAGQNPSITQRPE
jgi:hypothetical protein